VSRRRGYGAALLILIVLAARVDAAAVDAASTTTTQAAPRTASQVAPRSAPHGAPNTASNAAPNAPHVLRDCPDCPELVVLPTGTAIVGADASEGISLGLPADLAAREQPRRRIPIARPIAFGRFEITIAQFAAFVADTGYAPEPGCWRFESSDWTFDTSLSWRDAKLDQRDDHPVTCVNWHDADAYVRWLSKQTGQTYRLPSEVEWEYAARAGTEGPYWFGSDRGAICRFVNLGDLDTEARFRWAGRPTKLDLAWTPEACHDGFATTSPVNAKPPNGFGIYGVLGNVMEWAADCWFDDYSTGPVDQIARTSSGDGGYRVMRGQGWVAIAGSARASFRRKMAPGDRRFTFGIRVVRDVSGP
jgi:formylglycine-generating enzyme required for sulfatase activity